ncbi:MAG: flagellin [Planctomycetes bacterium]|nr:flagellin [Planctomycetota bacterium]NOG53509.1 flagellin [Planctomycetota bacterium]
MSRIITNVPSLIAQRTLQNQNIALATSLERLSTGLRINRGADDPAGLIASESLRSEKIAISTAISNAERAEQVVNVAEGGLQEISSMLIELQGLVGASANESGLSQEEKDANQLQIDSILQTIDRIANMTSFKGTKLLNGNFDYTTSGINESQLSEVTINAAKLPTSSGAYMTVNLDVVQSAQTGSVFLSTGSAFDVSGQAYTIEITGNLGTQQFTFASNTSQSDIIDAINQFKDVTGVSATQDTTDTAMVNLRATTYGSTQFVSAKYLDGNQDNLIYDEGRANAANEKKDYGRDATLLINGTQATTDGLTARVSSEGLDVEITIDTSINSDGQTSSFYVTGGGATFSLAPNVNLAGKVSIGIETVTTGNLGTSTLGYISSLKSGGTNNLVTGDIEQAKLVVDESVKQVASLRGRLGSFQANTVGSTIRNLGVTFENTAAAEGQIRETDFAAETANLTRSQILVQAATQVLSIANLQPQNVLALLG